MIENRTATGRTWAVDLRERFAQNLNLANTRFLSDSSQHGSDQSFSHGPERLPPRASAATAEGGGGMPGLGNTGAQLVTVGPQ